MDFLSLVVRSLKLGDVEPSRESYPQAERVSMVRENQDDSTRERGIRRYKLSKEKSREGLRTIALDEVAWHDTSGNCWLVIYDYVYDCTEFLSSHPGGQDVLLEYAGRDATLAFIGTGHSAAATATLDRYIIGELPPEERIFRVPGGVKVFGF